MTHDRIVGASLLCVVAAWVTASCPSHAAEAEAKGIGDRIESFALPDFRRRVHDLSELDDHGLVVVAFLGTECPLAKLYGPRLADLCREFSPRGVAFLGINSNLQDSITEIESYVRRHEIPFPMLKDAANRVADRFGAERTPEVFVLDAQRRVRYRGRIDDQYGVGYSRERPTRLDLREALEDLLAGREVSRPLTEAVGCHIGRIALPSPTGEITYSNQISRILQRHCVQCHREGEIAPFSLTDYDEVVGWAMMIQEVVDQQRMPPWHADPEHGRFANARLMTDDEKRLIRDWVRDGAPRGDPDDLPEPPSFPTTGWRLPRSPDRVLSMRDRPFQVPAEGVVEYQYFVVDPGFREDQWVTGAEVVPGNRAVVHHAIVFVRPPDGVRQRGMGWLTAYVPGQGVRVVNERQGRRVPAGSKLVFQMHYTPTGTPQQDVTKVGLLLGDPERIEEELMTVVAIDRGLEIPPRAGNHEVAVTIDRWPEQGRILAISPHMHLRGKSFRFVAHRDGERETWLNVPRYDFNWQHAYLFERPKEITPDLKLECTAHYDNSENNLVNPDPDATVRWGDQTDDEMFLAYVELAVPREDDERRKVEDRERERRRLARRDARGFIERFDKDGDGGVMHDEVPASIGVFAFRRFDLNGDKVITLEEAVEAALRRPPRENSP